MKKQFLLMLFVVMCSATYSQSNWTTITSENFEGTFPSTSWSAMYNSGYTNAYWGKVNNVSHTGSYSAWCAAAGTNGISPTLGYYPDNTNSWLVYGPFDLSDALAARLSFYLKYSTEPTNDYFYYGVSIDNGSYYGNYLTGTSNTWTKYIFNLADSSTYLGNLCGQKNIRIAFNFKSNGTYNHYSGAYIDDIILEKYSPMNLKLIDLETIGQNWNWKLDDGSNGTCSLEANPSPTGINKSMKCLYYDEPYSMYCTMSPCIGDEIYTDNIGDLTLTSDNCKIKLMVFKSLISNIRVRLYNKNLQYYFEKIVSNTSTYKWEELTFDFTDNIGSIFDRFSIFPDSRSNSTTSYCYIDNISFNSFSTGLNDISTSRNVSIDPNPVSDNFHIIGLEGTIKVVITDLSGKVLIQKQVSSNENISVNSLTKGMYLISLSNNGVTYQKKLIKK